MAYWCYWKSGVKCIKRQQRKYESVNTDTCSYFHLSHLIVLQLSDIGNNQGLHKLHLVLPMNFGLYETKMEVTVTSCIPDALCLHLSYLGKPKLRLWNLAWPQSQSSMRLGEVIQNSPALCISVLLGSCSLAAHINLTQKTIRDTYYTINGYSPLPHWFRTDLLILFPYCFNWLLFIQS